MEGIAAQGVLSGAEYVRSSAAASWHGMGQEETFSRMVGGPMILGFGRSLVQAGALLAWNR